jgi:hypothetical protein
VIGGELRAQFGQVESETQETGPQPCEEGDEAKEQEGCAAAKVR